MKQNSIVENVIKNAVINFAAISKRKTRTKKEVNRFKRRLNKQELKNTLYRYQAIAESTFTKKDDNSNINPTEILQTKALREINNMKIPKFILNKTFAHLNNEEIKILATCLENSIY
jgi:hypothetical protein